jgi:hypothetical protein
MTRVFFAWLVLAAMCILLVFKINLNSDLLFLDSVVADLFSHGGAWGDWKLTPAPAYMPDMLAYALGYLIFPTPAQRIVFVCLVQALLLAWCCTYFARVVKPSFSTNARLCVLLVTTVVVLVSANSSMWLFFNSTNNHFAALLFPLLCLAWIFEFLEKKALSRLFWVTGGVTIGTASTSIFTLAFTIPALLFLTGCVFVFRSHRAMRSAAFRIAGAILAGQVIALLLQKLLLSHNALQGRAPLTIEAALRSMAAFVSATKLTFGADNIYTLVLAIFLLMSIAWLLADWLFGVKFSFETSTAGISSAGLHIPAKNWAYGLSVSFLLVAFPVNVIGAVLSGGFADAWGYRYFAFPITLGVLLWVLMLDFKSTFEKRWVGAALLAAIGSLAVLGIVSLKPLLLQTGRTTYSEVFDKGGLGPGDAVAECVDQEARKGFAFGAGIGDFWNARGVSYKTAKPLYILPVVSDLTPFFHMMSLGPLLDPGKYRLPPYNFVVMRKSGTTTQFDFTPATTGRLLPPPARIVSCENTDSELWLYTDSGLDAAVKKKVNQFLGQEGLFRRYLVTGPELPGTVGKVQSLSRVAQAGIDAAGYLSYGPYVRLPPGRYQATVSYTATEPGNKWDAGRFNTPEKLVTVAAGEVLPGSGDLKFSFETKKKITDFEIRTWFGGRGTFTVHKVLLQPASSTASGHSQ